MSLRREPKVKTATFTSQSRHPQLVPYGRNPDPVEKSPFPNILSTSQVVEFVERASAKLFEEFDQQQCEALVTVRVDVNHLRPCLRGPSLTAVATFVGWDEQEGDKPPVIRVACTVSDSVDGPAGIIARADAWFSLVCRINLESAACLRLDNYWTLTHTLSEARQSWTTGHHRPSGLDHAIKHGDNDLVRHWLKKARPALDGDHLSSGLQLAKQCGNAFAVKLILHKYKIDKKSLLLKDAVKCGQLDTVQALLAEGADPQVDYSPGNTDSLLHTAAYAGYTAICDALLKAGADIEGGNEYAVTPLLMSIWGPRSLDTVKFLIQRGAEPNGTEDEDWAPLHFAVKFGYPGLVEFLIANGADPTLKTRMGDTPLMLAVKYGNKTRARELLACGVDASLGEGRCTALEWVRGENVPTGLTRADRCLRP